MAKVHVDSEFDDLLAAAFEESAVPFIEAVASTIEGTPNGEAWRDFELVTARAILLSYLLGIAQVLDDAEIAGADLPEPEKVVYAQSDCGAGKDGAPGFQPGNTCAGDGDGKAEPGESRHTTSTPEFKAWFGDSKVVDDDGEPLVVYHGTSTKFDSFNTGTENSWSEALGIDTFFFSKDESTASTYAGVFEEGVVLQTHLKIENPLVIDDRSVDEWVDALEIAVDRLQTYRTDEELEFLQVRDRYENKFWEDLEFGNEEDIPVEEREKLQKAADKLTEHQINNRDLYRNAKPKPFKHDGIIVRDVRDMTSLEPEGDETGSYNPYTDVYVAFNPTQIKSATDNTGKFDPDNPKITHAKETYAKDDWPLGVGFEEFTPAPFQEAIDIFGERIPMLAQNVPHIAAIARQQAAELAMAEKLGVVAKLDAQTNAISKALGTSFWVTGVDQKTTISLKNLIGDALRGVLPDESISLPDFIDRAWLSGAQDLTAARLETVYRTNMQTAYNEGHMATMRAPEVKHVAPLVMIVEIQDPRSRPHHAAMDGYVNTVEVIDQLQLRPPNGFNCRGTVRSVSWTEAETLGLVKEGEIDLEALDRYNGKRQGIIDRGEYPDPGFSKLGRAA
jgi:SPP1 gp7 family putative phage head morphogenesis protein